MSRLLFLDIETIPCHEESRAMYLEWRKHREKNYDSELEDEYWHDSGIDGAFGRICCLAYISETPTYSQGVLRGEEPEILRKFWQLALNHDLFVGHNIMDFDLPFIYKRSIIHNILPSRELNFARYKNDPIFDTMRVWDRWGRNSISLDTLSKIFGLPTSKDDINGSQVWDEYRQGHLDRICEYCLKDVILTRQVYYRLQCRPIPNTQVMPPVNDLPF